MCGLAVDADPRGCASIGWGCDDCVRPSRDCDLVPAGWASDGVHRRTVSTVPERHSEGAESQLLRSPLTGLYMAAGALLTVPRDVGARQIFGQLDGLTKGSNGIL